MSTRWRVIDLTSFSGEVKAGTGRIIAGGQEFPLADVGCVLLGEGSRWSGALTALTAHMDVVVLSCDWRGIPIAAMTPWSDNTRVAARQLAQASMSRPRMKNAWMRIVRAKVTGQALNLPPGEGRDKLLHLAACVRSGDPDNIEARAARTYWSRMFTGEGFRRDAQGEGRNALLNYGYAVLRGMVLRSAVAAGLSPTLSIFHRHRSNAFALIDDLMEPFRPAVDYAVGGMLAHATLDDRDTRRALVAVLDEPMQDAGSSVLTSMTELAQRYAQYVEGGIDKLHVDHWIPPDG